MRLYLVLALVVMTYAQIQTPAQIAAVQRALAQAIPASAEALPRVQELFSHNTTRQYLNEFDADLAALPADTLFTMFWNELSVAELVHSFDFFDQAYPCGKDMTVDILSKVDKFYNQWLLQVLGFISVDPRKRTIADDWVETVLFGFTPFKNITQPDYETAVSRPYYAAINMFRASGGNPMCGPLTVVLSRKNIGDQILAVPFDSGTFQRLCADGQSVGQIGR